MSKIHILSGLGAIVAALWLGLLHRKEEPLEAKPVSVGVPIRSPEKTHPDSPAPRLAAALRSGLTTDKDEAFNVLLPQLLDGDLTESARLAESLESWAWREDVMHRVARTWAARDFASAARWAANLKDPGDRALALNDVCIEAATNDAAGAVKAADRLRQDLGDTAIMENLLQIWAGRDPAAASAWLEQQPADEARDKSYSRVALEIAKNAPVDGANLAIQKITPGPLQDEAVVSVLHQWLKSDPQGAAAWVADFPASDLRDRAEEELAGAARHP